MADEERWIAIMPANGWRSCWRDSETKEIISMPLVGWALQANGEIVPLTTDADGAMDGLLSDGEVLYHPDRKVLPEWPYSVE